MLPQAALHIIGDARIKRAVAAFENVQKPRLPTVNVLPCLRTHPERILYKRAGNIKGNYILHSL